MTPLTAPPAAPAPVAAATYRPGTRVVHTPVGHTPVKHTLAGQIQDCLALKLALKGQSRLASSGCWQALTAGTVLDTALMDRRGLRRAPAARAPCQDALVDCIVVRRHMRVGLRALEAQMEGHTDRVKTLAAAASAGLHPAGIA
jgi:hypothetical protein